MADKEVTITIRAKDEFSKIITQAAETMAKAAEKMNKAADKMAEGLKKPEEVAVKASKSIGTALSDIGENFEEMGRVMQRNGRVLTGQLTAPLVLFGKSSVEVAMKIDRSWRTVQKVFDGTAEQINNVLKPAAAALSKEWGISQIVIADAMGELAAMGYETEDIVKGVTGAVEVSKLGNLEMAESMELVVALMQNYGVEGEELTQMIADLNAVEDKGAARLSDMATSIGRVASIAKEGGVDIKELGAMISVLVGRGEKATIATRALRTTFSRLLSPTASVNEALGILGVTMKTGTGEFKGMDKVLVEIAGKWAKLDEVERVNIATMIAGRDHSDRFIKLMQDMSSEQSEYGRIVGETSDSQDNMNNMIRQLGLELDSPQVKLAQLKIRFETLRKEIGDNLAPKLIEIGNKIADLADKFLELDEKQQDAIINIGLFLAAIGPFLVVFGMMAQGFGAVVKTIGFFTSSIEGLIVTYGSLGGFIAANPLTATLIAAFLLLVAVGLLVAKNWDYVKGKLEPLVAKFKEVSERLKQMFEGAGIGEKVEAVIKFFQNMYDKIELYVGKIKTTLGDAYQKIKNFLAFGGVEGDATIVQALEGIWNRLKPIKEALMPLFDEMKANFKLAGEVIKTQIVPAFDALVEVLKPFIETILPPLKTIFVGTILAIVGAIGAIVTTVVAFFLGLVSGFANALPYIMHALEGVIQFVRGFVQFFTGLMNKDLGMVWEGVKQMAKGMIDFVVYAFIGLLKFFSGFVKGVVAFFKGLYDALIGHSIIPDMVEGIVNFFKSLGKRVLELVKRLVVWVLEKWTALKEKLSDLVDSIKTKLETTWEAVKTSITNVWEGIKTSAETVWEGIKNAIVNPIRTIIEWVEKAIEKLKEWFGTKGSGGDMGGVDNRKHGGTIPTGQHGLIVPGRQGDAVPIIAHAGERVVPRTGADVGTGGGQNININFYGGVSLDSGDRVNELARQVARVLGRQTELARYGAGY